MYTRCNVCDITGYQQIALGCGFGRFTTREGTRMCIDGKTTALARKLKSNILDQIDSVDQAREMIAEQMKLGIGDNSQIARMAELYYQFPEKFGIQRKLKQVKKHPISKMSALRGAITEVLREFIEAAEQRLDAEALSPHDTEAGSQLVGA